MNFDGASATLFSKPKSNSGQQYLLLDECLRRSELPQAYGVARRVIETLAGRIGHSSLDIGHIANELCYSKRTLQRRLRTQGYSFSELRDRVRCHYAIRSVLAGKERVDDIYTALDFSDRSSLTLAFKRWTGLSPRAFGRLYRDEVSARGGDLTDRDN